MSDANSLKGTNVQVAVRCRPMNADERKSGQASVITCDTDNKAIKIAYGPTGKKNMKSFTFDKVFGMYSRQEEVFNSIVQPIVDEVLAGFNCTIFAYGQTGTGKTHTMEGEVDSDENAGIVPRSVKSILEQLENSDTEFTIRVSFLELYNEELQDLLNVSGDKKLKLCEDVKKGGVVCQNLEEVTVLNAADIFDILHKGIQQRQTAATLCNKNSSRSHSIFTMKIMIKECNVEGEEVVRHGQLNLVDLAGSECVGRSGAKNDRAREAGSINQSLLTLGRVITALVDHHGHVPYRDSKLTRLLQESLGGKAKTCIIATLSPSQIAVEETMSTLDYAYRAKSIKNQPTVNQRLTKKVIMKEYLAEVETLRSQLQLTREKNGVYVDPATYYAMEARLASQDSQIQECEGALSLRTEEMKLLKQDKEYVEGQLNELQGEYEKTIDELGQTKTQLATTQDEVAQTFTELKTTEAVVTAHGSTEVALTLVGNDLLLDSKERRNDVGLLLTKVQKLSAAEEKKLACSQSFVHKLSGQTESLAGLVEALTARSGESAESLKGGVSQMLQEGRSTCVVLKSAIEEALQTLVQEADVARGSMTESCSSLESHLQKTKSQLKGTLQQLEQRLGEWLEGADESMQKALNYLNTQQQQMNAMAAMVLQHTATMNEFSASYLDQQLQHQQQAGKYTHEFIDGLKEHASKYERELLVQSEAAEKTVKAKAQEMERSFKSMLQNLVKETTEASEKVRASASSFASELTQQTDTGLDVLTGTFKASEQMTVDHVNSMDTAIQRTQDAFNKEVDLVNGSTTSACDTLLGVSETVGAKRKLLGETVGGLVTDVDGAIKKGCSEVRNTSNTAQTILTQVSSASNQMSQSSGIAMKNFNSYLDKEGEQLVQGIANHFSGVAESLGKQKEGLQSLASTTGVHMAEQTKTNVEADGNTPRKLTPKEYTPFPFTRSQVEIKRTAKDKLLQEHKCPETAEALPYPVVQQIISGTATVTMNRDASSESMSTVSSYGKEMLSHSGSAATLENMENSHPNASSVPPSPSPYKKRKTAKQGKGEGSSTASTPVKRVTTRARSNNGVKVNSEN